VPRAASVFTDAVSTIRGHYPGAQEGEKYFCFNPYEIVMFSDTLLVKFLAGPQDTLHDTIALPADSNIFEPMTEKVRINW
jgi:hypothetical protein